MSNLGNRLKNLFSGPENVQRLSASEFKQALATHPGAQLIDVRTPAEYKAGNIPHSRLINFQRPDFVIEMERLDKTKPLFIYCQSGGRSGMACRQLADKGFSQIYELRGGYGAWQ